MTVFNTSGPVFGRMQGLIEQTLSTRVMLLSEGTPPSLSIYIHTYIYLYSLSMCVCVCHTGTQLFFA